MKLIVSLLLALTLIGADKEWQTGTVVSVEYENNARSNRTPHPMKGTKYTIKSDSDQVILYHFPSTVFGGYRQDLAKTGDPIKFRTKKGNAYVLESTGKEHRLELASTTTRPKS
jgi:hypothetical protein